MDQPQLSPTPHASKSLLLPFSIALVIAGIAVSVVVSLSLRGQQSTDSRSRAQNALQPTVSMEKKPGVDAQFVVNFSDPSTIQPIISAFEFDITIAEAGSSVLGVTTEHTNSDAVRARIDSTQKRTQVPSFSPCYSVVIDGQTPQWPNSCRGIDTGSCTPNPVALNNDERKSFLLWKNSGKPLSDRCRRLAGVASPSASAPARQSVAPSASPTAENTQLLIMPEITIFSESGLTLSSQLIDILDVSPVETQFSAETKSGLVKLKAKLKNPRNPEDQKRLRESKVLFTITVPSGYQPTLSKKTIRGFLPVAPNTEVDLTTLDETP